MDAVIHPFKHWTRCPKCGGKDLHRAYCRDGWPSYDHQDFPARDKEQEHFDLFCRDCQFEWYEHTKDRKARL